MMYRQDTSMYKQGAVKDSRIIQDSRAHQAGHSKVQGGQGKIR